MAYEQNIATDIIIMTILANLQLIINMVSFSTKLTS